MCLTQSAVVCVCVDVQEFPKDTQLMGGNDFYDKTVSDSTLQIRGLRTCVKAKTRGVSSRDTSG
jgi:hypothetical protein